MKLATIRNGRPDGQLVVVSRDLARFVSAGRIAPTLQAALDRWDQAAPALADLSGQLDVGAIAGQPFSPEQAMAPLPRAYQFIDCSAYMGHLERVRTLKGSRDAELQSNRPLMYQGGSDGLVGARDPIVVPSDELATDFEAEIGVILGPVPMRPSREQAEEAIRLIVACNDVSLRRLVADDLQNGFGFFHSKPASSFAPVAATPTEFGDAWTGAKLNVKLRASVNGTLYGQPDAGVDMLFDFPDLIVAAAQTRTLAAGTILAAGTVANRHEEFLPIKRDGIGFACIAEARTVEKIKFGHARTPFLKSGDVVRIAVIDDRDNEPLGAIEQTVELLAAR